MQANIAPNRVDLQCYLWDCQRALTPYCTPSHRDIALHAEGNDRATVIVDSFNDDEVLSIAHKCLGLKLLQRHCGIPILPVHVFSTNPWLQIYTFNRDVQPLESKRGWIFFSEPEPEDILNIWKHYETKPPAAHNHNIKCCRWYLKDDEKSIHGIFRLHKYSTIGLEAAFYWLLFTPTVPGVSGDLTKIPKVEKKKEPHNKKRRYGSKAGPSQKTTIVEGNCEKGQAGEANIQTAANDLRVESFQDPMRKQVGADKPAFGYEVVYYQLLLLRFPFY